MSLIIECSSFTATPLSEGKFRLDIQEADAKPTTSEVYEAAGAVARLSELLGRSVSRNNLAYWRENLGLPHNKVGQRKFLYSEVGLTNWANSRSSGSF